MSFLFLGIFAVSSLAEKSKTPADNRACQASDVIGFWEMTVSKVEYIPGQDEPTLFWPIQCFRFDPDGKATYLAQKTPGQIPLRLSLADLTPNATYTLENGVLTISSSYFPEPQKSRCSVILKDIEIQNGREVGKKGNLILDYTSPDKKISSLRTLKKLPGGSVQPKKKKSHAKTKKKSSKSKSKSKLKTNKPS